MLRSTQIRIIYKRIRAYTRVKSPKGKVPKIDIPRVFTIFLNVEIHYRTIPKIWLLELTRTRTVACKKHVQLILPI